MVLKKTSKEGFVFPRSENPKGAFLADFDIDGASLKKLHEDWLKDNVVDPAKAKRHTKGMWEIELSGRASKSGSVEKLPASGLRKQYERMIIVCKTCLRSYYFYSPSW